MKTENFSKTKIKICGLRRREDILAVNEANPDYCGFIVEFPKSFRSVTADEVRELVKNLSPEIQPVGVFVNASMELVRSLLDDGTLEMDESLVAKRIGKSTFEQQECLKCKMLPMCMGPCSQKLLEHDGKWTKGICTLNSIDTSLSDYLSIDFLVKSLTNKYEQNR